MFKGFIPTLGYVLLCLCFVGFPEGFCETKKTFETTKNTFGKTKENKKKPSGNQTTTKCLKVSYQPLDMFFCLFFGFPEGFYKTNKTFEKTTNTFGKTKETKTKTFGKTKQTKLLKVSYPPLDMFFGFPEGFCKTKKTFEKTNKHKKTNPYPRVGLKPLKTLFFGFPEGFFCFLWFFVPKVLLVVSKVFLVL